MKDTEELLLKGLSPDQPRHLHLHQIPVSFTKPSIWKLNKDVRGNKHILSGYRTISPSVADSLCTISQWHNETINIFTHLLGSVLFLLAPFYFYTYHYISSPNSQPIDILLFTTYSFGVSACFGFSTSYHLVRNHSAAYAKFFNELDHLGIILLMWTASLPSIYYGLICDPFLQALYWILMTALAAACTAATLSPNFAFPVWRTALYATLGMSSLVFVTHGVLLYGLEIQTQRMALKFMGWMAVLNFTGAAIYVIRFPERWHPYRFDFIGASHQIFHVLIVSAALVHFWGLLGSFEHIRGVENFCGA
ncbi:putative hemolysin-III channel protein Izh2 [Mollisia scopiformis]|uniref:Putative hemolysin-III channel protein Izh2 n=1 Tax=Mollisia scopiformis TaxID=149040 RepID=A0A194XX24_MOLSC|nr:putative hemolysin-III channel protein Izh2 [Mollisia scopiformis]KUJ24624.1 putative hemolysin-III channel protein Izh2 [Mollisia scopiformis]